MRSKLLDTAEDTQSQQIEVRSAKHDPFLKFQAIDLCFDLTLTPLGRKRRFDCDIIEANPFRHFLNSGRPLCSAKCWR